jgi:fumarate reductase subunit C
MSNSTLRGTPERRVPPLKPVKTYVRSMDGWSKRNPFYFWYLLREATCVAVGYYALLLICALERLTAGEAAFTHFMQAMASPGWIVVSLVMLLAMIYHAWTWFAVMPKTMPFVFVGGKRVSDATIVGAGGTAAVIVSLLILIAFLVCKP